MDVFHPFAPLAHPLPVVMGAGLSPLEPATAFDVASIACAACFGLFLVAGFRLAAVLAGAPRGRAMWAAGALTVVLLLSSDRIDFFAVAGTVDIPAAALTVLALSLVLEAPRTRPWLPLALLAAAGLLRPETWMLGPAYCAWLAWDGLRGRRLGLLAVLAVAPPVLWLLFATAAAGDPLSPLGGNPDAVSFQDVGFASSSLSVVPEGAGDVLDAVQDGVWLVLGHELALLALIAAVASVGLLARGQGGTGDTVRIAVAVAVAVALLAGSVVLTALGAVFTDRYVLTAAVILVAVLAALVWRLAPTAAWALSALVLVLVLTEPFGGPVAPTLEDVREELSFAAEQRDEQEDLYSLTSERAVRDAIAECGEVFVGGEGRAQEVLFAKPLVAHGLEIGPERVLVMRVPPRTATSSSFVRDSGPGETAPEVRRGRWSFTSACLDRATAVALSVP